MATMVTHECPCGRKALAFISKVTLAGALDLNEDAGRLDEGELLRGDLDRVAEIGAGLGMQTVTLLRESFLA